MLAECLQVILSQENIGQMQAMGQGNLGFLAGLGSQDGGFQRAAVVGHDFQNPLKGLEGTAFLFDLGFVANGFSVLGHGMTSLRIVNIRIDNFWQGAIVMHGSSQLCESRTRQWLKT